MTQIWAHRGSSHDAPENTLAAFELALQDQADGIELDVQLSADGVVVVCHDETIDRTSDGSGTVAELTLAQLREHDFGHGWPDRHPIPTLAEVLDLVAPTDLRVNVELKNSIVAYPGLEQSVEEVVAGSRLARAAAERLVYSSFNHRSLRRLAEAGTTVPLGVLHVEPLVRSWDYVAMVGAQALHPYAGSLAEDEIAQCRARGVEVNVWTVDDPDLAQQLARAGASAVITNVPARLRPAMAEVIGAGQA